MMKRNSKSEILSAKQIRNPNDLNGMNCFGNLDFDIKYCLGFSALRLGFRG